MDRGYVFHESTTSICSMCLERVVAKIVFKENKVFLRKHCKIHGMQEELFEDDIDYYKKKRE